MTILRNTIVALLVCVAGWKFCWAMATKPAQGLAVKQVSVTRAAEPKFSLRKIEDIRAGDQVYARDPVTGETSLRRVVRTFARVSRHLQLLDLQNLDGSSSRIETTGEHPFFVKDRGQVNAADLELGDQIETLTGHYATLTANLREPHPEGIPVYNFEVQHDHTYFVLSQLANGSPLWVHNSCYEAEVIPNKSVNVGDQVSFDQAVDIVTDGGDIVTDSVGEARRIAEQAGDGPPVWHDPSRTHDGLLREGHYHPGSERRGNPMPGSGHIIPRKKKH
jgi:hypothetical protein